MRYRNEGGMMIRQEFEQRTIQRLPEYSKYDDYDDYDD